MSTLASEEFMRSLRSIEDARVLGEGRLGRRNADDIALAQLGLLLSEQQEALRARPFGYGHSWNIWAAVVAIEQVRRSSRWSCSVL